MVFSAFFTIGGFLDGWAHYNGRSDTSFFTPWHAVLYLGFLATAGWICAQVRRRQKQGATGMAAVPISYGLGLLGAGVFATGGMFDMVWHEIFGIEVGVEALLSPGHLLLFVGSFLLLSCPLRAAWSRPSNDKSTYAQLLPALLSTAFTTALVAFFFKHHSPFFVPVGIAEPYRWIEIQAHPSLVRWLGGELDRGGAASILLTTVTLVAPMLVLLRRWRPPQGAITLIFGIVTILTTSMKSFSLIGTVPAAILAGLVADVVIARRAPSPARPRSIWALGAAVPAVLWLTYFGAIALGPGLSWSVELWAGSTMMAALVGAGLAVLAAPSENMVNSDRFAPVEERKQEEDLAMRVISTS